MLSLRRTFLLLIAISAGIWFASYPSLLCAANPGTLPERQLLSSAYGGGETLEYEISWLGIKAGKLVIDIEQAAKEAGQYRLKVSATTAGLLEIFYPVDDLFVTLVQGRKRLPVRFDFWQKEGKRQNYRLTLYDQEKFIVSYAKNDNQPVIYTVDGPVHNEFSSFVALRAMPLQIGKQVIVPTFADKKRHEVRVSVQKRKKLPSIFGEVDTIQVQPHLNFKGLYEKLGDPVIWMTDDEFRIPVRIKASIVIGSFTAKLVNYKGKREVPVKQQASSQ